MSNSTKTVLPGSIPSCFIAYAHAEPSYALDPNAICKSGRAVSMESAKFSATDTSSLSLYGPMIYIFMLPFMSRFVVISDL